MFLLEMYGTGLGVLECNDGNEAMLWEEERSWIRPVKTDGIKDLLGIRRIAGMLSAQMRD